MSEYIDIELFGGLADGRRVALPPGPMPYVLRVPVVPSLTELLTNHHLGEPTISPESLLYEWDGTEREDGVRRFRLR